MRLSQDELRHIVAQSSSLSERLHGHSVADATPGDETLIAQRLERWAQSAAAGHPDKFDRRLRWDGLDRQTVQAALGHVRYQDNQPVPAWASTLSAVVAQAGATDPGQLHSYTSLRPEAPAPFEEIFLPFVAVARQKLIGQAQDHLPLLAPQAHRCFDFALVQRLARVCFRTLEQEFAIFRLARQQSVFTLVLGQLQGTTSRQLYKDFVTGMYNGQWVALCTEYPVLARLTAQITDFWVEAVAEFLQHLAADLPVLQETFAVPVLGRVEALQTALSDPHHHGRSVIGVRFASGLKLIYKPKDLATEVRYFDIIAWLNQQRELLPLRVLRVINHGSHGWVEYAEAAPCPDSAAIHRYYQRSGMLLGLMYALRGSDFHYENILACGEQPMLVDFETLLAPTLDTTASSHRQPQAHQLAIRQLHDSVLQTGLLPQKIQLPGQDVLDISGLGAINAQAIKTHALRHVNTDAMGLTEDIETVTGEQNSPFAPDMPDTFREYIDDIVRGFREVYRLLVKHRQALLSAPGPLTTLAQQRYRFLYRNTILYTALLTRSCQPQVLRDGVEHSIALEPLCRALLNHPDKPRLWPVVDAERQAMEQLDVPVFSYRGDSTVLEAVGMAPIPGAFATSGIDAVYERIRQMNHDDLGRQVEIIRGSLYTRVLSSPTVAPGVSCGNVAPLPRQQLFDVARTIGQELAQRAIRAADGSVCWIGMHYDARTNHYRYQPLDSGLSNGTPGVAVFLAALARVTAITAFRELALGACAAWQQTLAEATPDTQPRLVRAMGIGAGNGIASTAYALATVSQLLEAPALLEAARHTAAWLTAEQLRADTHFDILHGTAGVLLVLLKLYRLTAENDCLDLAIIAGQHLVKHCIMEENGTCTWKTTYPRMLTGFSQGAAGIAYALLQLFAVTGEPTYRDVASAAIAYENTAFSAEAGNWYDYRPFTMMDGTPTCMTGWCHGAPGIGLARLAALPVLDSDDIQQDIAAALRTTRGVGGPGVDHLCCGTAGRIDVLLTAAHKLLRPDWHDMAQQHTAWMVQRAQQEHTFQLYANVPSDVYNPAVFQGTAGIGYTLLRLADPGGITVTLTVGMSVRDTQGMYDVVIVGAGCAGLIAAYELRHLHILLIEHAQEIGGRIMTRCHRGTSYDLGAVFALKKQLLPFHCTLSPLVPESKQVGLLYRGSVYCGRDVMSCLENVGIAAAEWENILAFATGRSQELAAISPETLKILQAFFHVIHPGAMQEYVPERQRDAFQTFPTDHYQHGNGEFLTYLQTFLSHKLRLGTEVLAVAEQPDRVMVTMHTAGVTSTLAASTVILTTPAPAALRLLTAPSAPCRAFLQSVRYAGGVVVALGFAGARLADFSYIVTPELPCNTVLKQTHPEVDMQVLLVYYVGEEAHRLQACSEAHIVAQTLPLLQHVVTGEALADRLEFSDVHRWPCIGPVLSPHSYARWDAACLRPSPRVFLAGDYTHVEPSNLLPYGMSAAIASGSTAANQVKAYFQPYTGTADFRQRGLLDVYVYAIKKDQPRFLLRKEEGNIAFYGLLLQAHYDTRLHDYLLNARQDSLWEYHTGFGITAEDSMLVMEALLATPQDAPLLARSAQRLVELFYCPTAGAFCTLSPHRHTVAACAQGRARYWEGPSLDATAQGGYLLHTIAPETYAQEVAACADYVARHQEPRGYWKSRWFPSTMITTYYAVRLLQHLPQGYQAHLDKARHFLLTQQQADGSWEHSVLETAAAILALKRLDGAPTPQAIAWLQAQRGPAGWAGEPVLYYWVELNQSQKLLYHCTDKGQITTAWATLALRDDAAGAAGHQAHHEKGGTCARHSFF